MIPTGVPRAAFVLSFLSAIGVAVAALATLWTFTNPNLGFLHGAEVVSGIVLVLAVSLVLAIMGLVQSLSWRRAGGRSGLNILSIALAVPAIAGVALGFLFFVLVVVLIVVAFSKI